MIKKFILVVLLIILGASSYYLYTLFQQMNAPPVLLVGNMSSNDVENIPEGMQFYPNMRFASPSISYNISDMCDASKKGSILEALSILENVSALKFYYADNAQIAIECNETSLSKIRHEKFYIAGEGGPTNVINTSLFYVISGGEVLLLYPKASCNFPLVEIHELLHVLGFQHSSNPLSIMYPTASCSQKITPEIVEELKELYSIPQEADLYFVNASAVKKGGYLDFSVNIRNRGLQNSDSVTLKVYADNVDVKDYDLGSINLGEGKSLDVQNLKVGVKAISVRFMISDGAELYTDNNIASFSVPAG